MRTILDRLIGKEAIVVDSISGHNYGPNGYKFTITKISTTAKNAVVGTTVDGSTGNSIYLCDFDIDPRQFLDPDLSSKLKKRAKRDDVLDEWGNENVLELRSEGEIYLSTSLRADLELKEGDKVIFAEERGKNNKVRLFIAKDPEGYEVNNGVLKSVSDHKVINRTFDQTILCVNYVPTIDPEHQDLLFYEITRPSYPLSKGKSEIPSKSRKSVFKTKSPTLGEAILKDEDKVPVPGDIEFCEGPAVTSKWDEED